MPWILDVAAPTAAATTGDNVVDNVEKIEITAPVAGEYIVRVSHKGHVLVDDSQVFSLILSGIKPIIDFGWMMTLGLITSFIITFKITHSIICKTIYNICIPQL
jgi:hypothetical protein